MLLSANKCICLRYSLFMAYNNSFGPLPLLYGTQDMASFVPEWAKSHTGDHGDHGAMDHDAATTASPAHHGTDANQHDMAGGHDMAGDSKMEEEATNAGQDMGETTSSSSEFDDMGADMNEAVELANGQRLLRGRRLHDGDHGMSHQDDSVEMANKKSYDDGGCVSISEEYKDMLPSSWWGTSSTHVHPKRPINKGIYTMDGFK